jgi:hypothetical protein
MATAETGTGVTGGGTLITTPYVFVGPVNQTYGYGWGTSTFGTVAWGEASASTNSCIVTSELVL